MNTRPDGTVRNIDQRISSARAACALFSTVEVLVEETTGATGSRRAEHWRKVEGGPISHIYDPRVWRNFRESLQLKLSAVIAGPL
jgi:hypothetical protein